MTTFAGDTDFDQQFARTLAAATRGCADLGEASATASRITPGDVDSWAREWTATADAAVAEGDASLADDHVVSARRCYLRAAEYYRQAFYFARDDLDSGRLHAPYNAHVSAFRSAMPLLPFSSGIMDVGRDGIAATGYLLRPDDSTIPRPTVIAPADDDSTAEAGYSAVAVGVLERGMNCLMFEGPGQGGVLYQRRQFLRPDFETVLTPVVDWLIEQDGVDPQALVLFGRGIAGYLALRGATGEHRLAALVCDAAQYDVGAATLVRAVGTTRARRSVVTARMASHGVSSVADYSRELRRFRRVGIADEITCPVLALAGEGEIAATGPDGLDRIVYDWIAASVTFASAPH